MQKQRKKIRLAYLSGPVDAVNVYNAWAKETALQYFGTSYLKQFYQACAEYGADGYVITTLHGNYTHQNIGDFLIENRPAPSGLSGLRYHIANCVWIIKLVPSIIRFRPDVLILTAAYNYWFVLSILKLFGIVFIPVIHDSLWKRFQPLKLPGRVLRRLSAFFLSSCVAEVMVAAESTAAQVRSLVPQKKLQIEVFLPTYPQDQFASIRRADFNAHPFKILFMGRIETNKGIYDLVEMASQLDPGKFHIDLSGDGSELASLRRRIDERGLMAMVSCHGFLAREELYRLLDQAHVVIVPTTTDFEEGFNMVCAEAILSGRPVITSAVCPALAYIRDAAIEVPPNNIDRYRDAIIGLATDRSLYEEKRSACRRLQNQFYDPTNSWGAKLQILLQKHIRISSAY